MGDELEKIVLGEESISIAEDRPGAKSTGLRTAPGSGQGSGRTPEVIQKGWAIAAGEKGKKVVSRERKLIQIIDRSPSGICENFVALAEDGVLHSLEFPISIDRLQEVREGHLSFSHNPVIKRRVTAKSLLRQSRNMRPADKNQGLGVFFFYGPGDSCSVDHRGSGAAKPHVPWFFLQNLLQGLRKR